MSYSDSADDNLWIAPKYYAEDWRKLDLRRPESPNWSKAVDIFDNRIYGRFLAPVDAIANHHDAMIRWFSGFTIIAIDCLLIETLYQFYNGVDETNIDHQKAFWHFFRDSAHFKPHFTRKKAYKFYTHFRCGILHQAQTKIKSKIRLFQDTMVQLIDPNDIDQGLIIDREKFHQALHDEINDYMTKLRNPKTPEDHAIRKKFVRKMSYIIK